MRKTEKDRKAVTTFPISAPPRTYGSTVCANVCGLYAGCGGASFPPGRYLYTTIFLRLSFNDRNGQESWSMLQHPRPVLDPDLEPDACRLLKHLSYARTTRDFEARGLEWLHRWREERWGEDEGAAPKTLHRRHTQPCHNPVINLHVCLACQCSSLCCA